MAFSQPQTLEKPSSLGHLRLDRSAFVSHALAAAVIDGRGVPLLWASYEEWVLYKSQNNLEKGLLRLLKSMLPEWITVIVVADRGFGPTELARTCQQMGFHYVIMSFASSPPCLFNAVNSGENWTFRRSNAAPNGWFATGNSARQTL